MMQVFRGDPVVQKDLMALAEIGAGRSAKDYGALWGGKTDPTSYMSKFMHFIDKSMRLTLSDAFDNNVAMGRYENTEQGRRDFINKSMGNYNKLTQHKLLVLLRDLGIGPFATAGSTYIGQGFRTLIGQPLATPTSKMAALSIRAEKIAKVAAVLGAVAAANVALWGSIWGDDDTPLGAVKTGTTEDGKTTYMDFTNLTGWTRGMRQTGLLAVAEGLRQGTDAARIGDRAFSQSTASLTHPAFGPAAAFVHTAFTGRNSIGMQVAEKPPPSGSQTLENLKAAAVHSFQPLELAFGHSHEDQTWGQRALEVLGPYNPFRIRGDQRLAEMHGALRHIEDARRVFMSSPGNLEGEFPQEAEYRVLDRLNRQIERLNTILHGRARTTGGTRQLDKPELAEIADLRRTIRELAGTGLEIVRDLRVR